MYRLTAYPASTTSARDERRPPVPAEILWIPSPAPTRSTSTRAAPRGPAPQAASKCVGSSARGWTRTRRVPAAASSRPKACLLRGFLDERSVEAFGRIGLAFDQLILRQKLDDRGRYREERLRCRGRPERLQVVFLCEETRPRQEDLVFARLHAHDLRHDGGGFIRLVANELLGVVPGFDHADEILAVSGERLLLRHQQIGDEPGHIFGREQRLALA